MEYTTGKIGMVYASKDPDGGYCYYEYRANVGYTKYAPFATLEDADRAAEAHAAQLPHLLNYVPAEAPTEEAAEEATAAEDAEPQRLTYINTDGSGATNSTAEALRWHRAGYDLIIYHPGRPAAYLHGAPQEAKRSSEDENRAHCKHIALELDAYVNGELKRCPECGEIHRRDWDELGDVFRCPECGCVRDVFDWDTLSIWEFFDDCYDIEYRCDSRREYRSVRVMVACGGPNIYIDSATGNVELYWWSDRAWYPLSDEARAELDTWAEEYWQL